MNALALPRAQPILTTGRVEIVHVRRHAVMLAKRRAALALLLFAGVAALALLKIVQLGFANHASAMAAYDDALVPVRADVVDRGGLPLARMFSAYALDFNPEDKTLAGGPPLVRSPQELARALVAIFPDMNEAKLAAQLASAKGGVLRRNILPEEADRVQALGERALQFPRLPERLYPQGPMAAHVLGFVDAKGHGQLGMEQVLDHRLTDPASRASPAVLSLDARVQGALEDELWRGMMLSGAKGAAGIVLDVDSGEVMALASLPSFDPNRIDHAGAGNMFNRVSSQPYELGSVFKPLTVATGIDNGTITDLARRYPAGQAREVGGHLVHDDKNFGASLNVPEALVHSSNIVLAQVGDELGGARLSATLRALGFDVRPQIELPARGMPKLQGHDWPAHGNWTSVTTTTAAYGHGLSVTPLHMALAYAALVNGGVWHPATLLRRDADAMVPGRRIWKASTSARMRQLLRMIVQVGTGKSANAAGFRVGGKTGTAERSDSAGYHKDRVVTTFAAAFPMDHPRYVVLTTLDEPQANSATSFQRTAAYNAAPIVGRLVPRIGPLLGIVPDATRDIDISDVSPLVADGNGE